MQQSIESIIPSNSKEKSDRRTKLTTICVGLFCLVAIIVIIVLSVIDHRVPDPDIELPMIKEYAKTPLGMTKA